jgi:hypothetical protein
MTHTYQTTLLPAEVLERAKQFFATRVPATGAFVEVASDRHVVFRGQGGEEIVIAALPGPEATTVRGSTFLFDQQVKRFFSTLPPASRRAA